jgi:tetratricopeptide (TPR) repeat protein
VLGSEAPLAAADTDLVVAPAVGDGSAAVNAALASSKVGTVSTQTIDAACAADPGCMIKLGASARAKRALSITVAGGGKLTLMVVDVGAQLLLGTRDVEVAPKKLAKELGPALRKFVEAATVDKAKALFAEGNQHYNLGEFTPALERYKLAYRVKPLPAFQFNIAQCHRKLGQFQEAVAMYQAYLVGVPNAQNKAVVESLIAEAKKAHADKLALETQRERDRLAAESKQAEEARKAKEAQAAADAERARAEQARIAAEREREATYDRHPARTWMLVTGALGVGAAGAGIYVGTQAKDLQTKFDNLGCGNYPDITLQQPELEQCDDYRTRGKRNALMSNVLIGSGAAVVLASLLVIIIDPGNVERPTAARASVAVSPSSFNVVVQW